MVDSSAAARKEAQNDPAAHLARVMTLGAQVALISPQTAPELRQWRTLQKRGILRYLEQIDWRWYISRGQQTESFN